MTFPRYRPWLPPAPPQQPKCSPLCSPLVRGGASRILTLENPACAPPMLPPNTKMLPPMLPPCQRGSHRQMIGAERHTSQSLVEPIPFASIWLLTRGGGFGNRGFKSSFFRLRGSKILYKIPIQNTGIPKKFAPVAALLRRRRKLCRSETY